MMALFRIASGNVLGNVPRAGQVNDPVRDILMVEVFSCPSLCALTSVQRVYQLP
jgi:hypothetical protein